MDWYLTTAENTHHMLERLLIIAHGRHKLTHVLIAMTTTKSDGVMSFTQMHSCITATSETRGRAIQSKYRFIVVLLTQRSDATNFTF